MATAAPSPLASSIEKRNGGKLSRLLIDGGTSILRKVFGGHHPPANLVAGLSANIPKLNILLKKKVLCKPQWDKLFPPGGAAPDSNTFDITLLFLLLINICGLSPPCSGWHAKPPPSDTSHEANLARVKFYRNVLYGHVTTTGVDTLTFSALWLEASAVLVALGLDQAEIDRLKAEEGGEQDYIDALLEWADREEDIKSQLKNIHQTVEEVHRTQTKTEQTVEKVHKTQTRTEQTMEEMFQTQTKTQQTVEKLHQTQTRTEQTQTKTQQTIEEVAAGLQEVEEAVCSLKEGRDKDRANECFQELATSEFRRDIEYFVEQFQPGTRELVFDRVQYWMDDRSSQNRVMVISGNAGIGKSVIAAVVCKRMQEVGRLSGSHFCHYGDKRYCKPQLMLQSLACHLSYALPEYKQALVEQLSRNLGIDLNNMGVEKLFALLFKEPLSAVGDPGRNMLMVIDGLDESEYQGRNELLDVIANQFCKLPSWIRFLMTTRPATNITKKLKHLKPVELQANDEENLADIRTFFEKRLQHVIKAAKNENDLVERLVLKSEGLMLFAHFLILFIGENPSILNQDDLDGSLPLGISSVYYSYFRRLESELQVELHIKEEHFQNLLCAITASREPLPIGFVSEVLVPNGNSCKVLKALECVSALFPIRHGCLHIIHKSIKDWLTNISCYGEHEFIMDENEGHGILADLCRGELDDLKRRGIHNAQFSGTERYALYHGAHHMLHSDVERRPNRLDELTKAYVIDLELVYAKTCVNSTTAAEDIVWLQQQGIYTVLSEESQGILNTLLFLLRKYLKIFTDRPCMFLQTMLNQGGTVLSAEASNLLQNKYREIPYMEYIHEDAQQGHVNEQTVLRLKEVQMLTRGVFPRKMALALDGQTVYVESDESYSSVSAWEVSSGKLIAKINIGTTLTRCLVPVRGGVLFTSSGPLELWKYDLSECVQRWTNLSGITEVIPISEERTACVEGVKVNVLNTTSGEIVSSIPIPIPIHGGVIACNSKFQLLTMDDNSGSLQLSDDRTVLWEMHLSNLDCDDVVGVFSPVEQFLVIWIRNFITVNPGYAYVLDAVSGNLIHVLSDSPENAFGVSGLQFVSDEEFVVSFIFSSLRLFNVNSGDLLSEIDVKNHMCFMAACLRNSRLTIGPGDSTPNFKVIQVWLPRDKDHRKTKRTPVHVVEEGALSEDIEEPTLVSSSVPPKVAGPGTPEYSQSGLLKEEDVLPANTEENSLWAKTNVAADTITSEGGVVAGKDVKLVCPPAAVDTPVYVQITLEDPSKYCGLIAQKDLENDVMFCGPIVNLQPNGHIFKKPVTLTTKLKIENFKFDNILILHGAVARDGKITWEDVTHNSKFNETNAEVNIEIERFSVIASLWRLTMIRTKDIMSRLNLLAFNYSMSVLLNESHKELALLFVTPDVYNEQFYREHETSALVQLKAEGFKELPVRSVDGQKEQRIYNHEQLKISVCLGEDYKLAESEQKNNGFIITVEACVWWSTGHVIKLSLERTKDARTLCGKISIESEYGLTTKRNFCELDLHGYVRELLDVGGAVFNLIPIAQMLKMPEESVDEVMKSWKDEDQQLEIILRHWLKDNDVVEDLAAFRKDLEGLKQEDYRVTQRGQMHARHLRDLATKIAGIQYENADTTKHFSSKIQTLCKTVLRDCCIELEHSAKGVDTAASSANHVNYLEMRERIPKDVARNYQQISSSSGDCTRKAFLDIVPYLIQAIKEIFVHEKILPLQNGLRGLSNETLEHFASNVQDAVGNNSVRQLVCEVCKILEQLCLENCGGKHSTAEIERWGNCLALLSMLEFLKPFFQHCRQDVRLHKRLELFSDHLRDIMSDQVDVTDEVFVRDFFNVSLSLIALASFDPSNLVRFELTDSTNSPVTCIVGENLKYDRHHDKFSQRFQIKKESEDKLQLHASACVHIDGRVHKIGAFQSVILLSAPDEGVFDNCMSRFCNNIAMAKQKDKDSEHLRVVLCSMLKEKLSEALNILRREMSESEVDLKKSEITNCHLTLRSISEIEGAVLSLTLVYKWGSEAVYLGNNTDFLPFADAAADDAYTPEVQLVGLTVPEVAEEVCTALAVTSADAVNSFAFDPRQLQKHNPIHCEKVEYHFHQTNNNMKGNVCVVGDETKLNIQEPCQREAVAEPVQSPSTADDHDDSTPSSCCRPRKRAWYF